MSNVLTSAGPIAIQSLIQDARNKTLQQINQERNLLFWQLGKLIAERKAAARRQLGDDSQVCTALAKELADQQSSLFQADQLDQYFRFYQVFPFAHSVCSALSWAHYLLLIGIDNTEKRNFFLEQSTRHRWPAEYLQKQLEAKLWERLQRSNSRLTTLRSFNTSANTIDPVQLLQRADNLAYLGIDLAPAASEKTLDKLDTFFLRCNRGFYLAGRRRPTANGDQPAIQYTEFYHRILHATVFVQVLNDSFEDDWHPLHTIMLQYDQQQKRSGEDNSIGILITNSNEQPKVSFLLSGDNNNIIREKRLFLPAEAEILAACQ